MRLIPEATILSGGSFVMSLPKKLMVPVEALFKPSIAFSKEDLPEPLQGL